MKTKTLLMLLVVMASLNAFSQKVKFRKIPVDLLKQTAHPLDSQAEAAYIYKSCRVYYVFNEDHFDLLTDVHLRLKIYKKEGLGWGDFKIGYHERGGISQFKAYTYNLVNGEVVETKLDNEEYNTEEFNKVIRRRTFAMPNLAPGSVIDLTFLITEPASISLTPYFLQHSIPVDYVEYEVETPEYFIFNKSTKGLPLAMERSSESKSGVINLRGQSGGINYSIGVDRYVAQNVPALKDEPFVPNMENYRSAVTYELSFIRDFDRKVTNFSSTWDDIANRYMTDEYFGKQLEARLSDLDPVVEMAMQLPEEERYRFVYYYVRDHYNWNEYNGEFSPKGLKKFIENKSGNAGDINLLLINLLNKAGVKAIPLVLSTREQGFLNWSYPSLGQINYVIAAIPQGEDYLFLDATAKYLDAGYLPGRTLNLDGVLITHDRKGIRISLENPNKGNVQNMVLSELTDDLLIKGQARTIYSGYKASVARNDVKDAEKGEGYTKELHDRFPNLDVISFKDTGSDSTAAKVVHNLQFELSGQADEAGDLIYLNPMMIWQDLENVFKTEKREFPVFYNSYGTEKHSITITLPINIQVESLPAPVRMSLPDNLGSFSYNVVANGTNISIQYLKTENTDIISQEYYEALRNYTSLIIDKQAEKVVLRRR